MNKLTSCEYIRVRIWPSHNSYGKAKWIMKISNIHITKIKLFNNAGHPDIWVWETLSTNCERSMQSSEMWFFQHNIVNYPTKSTTYTEDREQHGATWWTVEPILQRICVRKELWHGTLGGKTKGDIIQETCVWASLAVRWIARHFSD